MTERAYTVAEIDALRRAVYAKIRRGGYSYSIGMDGRPTSDQLARDHQEAMRVEDQVRTYMLAGLTAEDVEASLAPLTPPQQPQ